uniref:Galectin-related inter-fiber protein n=2 Tax=Corvus moneduloides TaxID=1196302 RepID=A0A8C3DGB2_CORMO
MPIPAHVGSWPAVSIKTPLSVRPGGAAARGRRAMALRFEALHPEGICPGWSIVVQGETSSSSSMFEINLLSDPGDQIALHFNPRFSSSRIVCNSFLNSHWGQEEVNNTFPFKAKEPFQVEIYSDQDYFHIFINENKVLQYKHRQKNLSSITKLQILNDIDISSVEITKRGL